MIEDIKNLISDSLAEIHTTLPGKIVSWDGAQAVVKPALPMQLTSGEVLNAPQIVSVPVHFPMGMGGTALISVPLQAGDDVTLHFSERSLENWLSGSDSAPDDPRQFDLTDAFATPVMRPTIGSADTDNVSMSFNAGSIKIAPSGEITIAAPKMTINAPIYYTQGMAGSGSLDGSTMSMNGPVAITGDSLTHNGKNIGDTHKHTGVVAGGEETGAPV